MALVTFLSDFGYSDHYVAAVKAKLLGVNSQLQILDISHQIEHYNISHAAYVLRSVFNEFPKQTVHLVAVGLENESIAVEIDNHYFIGPNNGLFSLISTKPASRKILLNGDKTIRFPAREVYAEAAAKLASGTALDELGSPLENYKEMLSRLMRASKKQITGHVIRIDHYGNLITNIEEEAFNILSKGKKYNILFAREKISRVAKTISEVDPGDCFVVFNSLGLMQIGIHQGHANLLLGMTDDSTVLINFEE